MRRTTAELQAQQKPQDTASVSGNDFVTLAWELGDCMAFEPKKWRHVFAQSHAVLQNGSKARAVQLSSSQHQGVRMKGDDRRRLQKAKMLRSDAGAARRSSSRSSGSSARRDEAPIAAESVRLPRVHQAPLSIAEYLNQPTMIEAMLQEARQCDDALDKDQASARSIQSETMSHTGHGNQAADMDSESSSHTNVASASDSMSARYSESKALSLPLLQVVSPRTRDGLARLPPPTQEDWRIIHELEKLPESKLSTQDFYRNMKRKQMRRLYATHHRDTRELQNEPMLLRHKRRSPSPSKSVSIQTMTAKKMSIVSPTRLTHAQQEEQILMKLEDYDVSADVGVITISSLPKSLPADDKPSLTSPLNVKEKSVGAYQQLTHRRKMLVREHDISITQAQAAQTQVAQTIEDIKQWIPLEVIYAYGMGQFASPAQQRATQVLFRAGVRLKHNLVVQAVEIWKTAIYAMRKHEARLSSICIQCWWRQIRAKQELKLRKRLRIKLQKRHEALRRALIGKQQHAALVITRAVRLYRSKCLHHRHAQEYAAAIKIQKFCRQRQSSWILLKIHLRKQQRHQAAIRIQSQVRGRQARAKRKILKKIARVEIQRQAHMVSIQTRKVKMKQLGAAIAIQRFFRDWEIKRTMVLRRRRARFEKDKIKICKVQAHARGQQTRRWYKAYKDRVYFAVLTLQCAWRQHISRAQLALHRSERDLQRQKTKEEIQERILKRYGNMVSISTYQVKRTWNQLKVFKDKVTQDRTELERKAAAKLQALWRGKRLRQRLRYEDAHQREQIRRINIKKRKAAAIEIQRRIRGIQGRSLAWRCIINLSAERIQRVWRGFKTRQKLVRMQRALRSIEKMQYQWKRRRERASQQLRTRAAQQIQRLVRKYLSKQWLYQMVKRQQFLSEEQSMGKVLVEETCRRIKDELLLQSFVFKTLAIQKDAHDQVDDEEDPSYVSRSLYIFDSAKKQWKRKGYDGVWQEVFRHASGGSLEIDNSHFARFLKSLPHSFINKSTFPTQMVDLVFTKMKEPKARTISFSRFNKAMKMIWQERFGTAAGNNRQSDDANSVVEDNDNTKYLHFMHRYVLPSTIQHGKFRSQLDVACTQRLQWSVAVIRRFGMRTARKKQHDHFLVLHQQNLLHRHEVKCTRLIQKCYRRYRFRLQLKSMLARLFVEYLDHNGRSVKFTHIETHKSITKRPIFLKGIRCQKRVPLPFPGEEFHAFCERHEDPLSSSKVHAQVYCMECEDAMCTKCFERDHNKRQTLQAHTRRIIQCCSHCGTETATRECLQCGNGAVPFCDACFPHVHAKQDVDPAADASSVDISQHRFQPLVVMCVECNARVAQWDCETCQDAYCKRCLSGFHAKGQRQHHQCHRLSYFSVLKQQTVQKRITDAQKERERRKKQREDERIQHEKEIQKQNDSATLIQAMARSYIVSQAGKRYMKLVRQTVAAKAQRVKDEKVRSSITYKLRNVIGMAPSLKSDTTQEIAARKERLQKIQDTLFLHRSLLRKNDPKAQKKWSKKKKQQIMRAADSWCVYDMSVAILKGEWRGNLGTIVSTQNLFVTGYVVVFIPLANRSIVIDWEHIVPRDEDQYARRPYEPIARVLLDTAHDFRVKLSAVVENTARMARLMYLQSAEFHDIVQYAWVVEFNKHEQREEYWNVVLNKRVFEVPKALHEIERMEVEPREALEDRVALAKTKILDLLYPFQPRDKTNLAIRRKAIISLPKWIKRVEGEDATNRLLEYGDAMAHAVFWHERIACNSQFVSSKILRFLAACHSAPYSTRDCWRVVQLWHWMDLYENDGFEGAALEFFKMAADHQLFVIREFTASLEQRNFKEAKEKLQQLLKLKAETRDLLIFNATQQQEQQQTAGK